MTSAHSLLRRAATITIGLAIIAASAYSIYWGNGGGAMAAIILFCLDCMKERPC